MVLARHSHHHALLGGHAVGLREIDVQLLQLLLHLWPGGVDDQHNPLGLLCDTQQAAGSDDWSHT